MKLLIARLIGLTTLALGAVLGQAPHLAMAVGCGTQWAAPVDGYWGDATKWTGGIPNNNVACIDVAGTYTVTVGVTPFNVDGLVVGGSSGTQTLLIDGGVIGTSLSMQAGTGGAVSSIGANGKLVLTNLTANAGAAIFRAPTGSDFDAAHITNNGTIEIIDGLGTAGAARYLSGNILNQGTIKVYRDTAMDTSSTLWKNQGAIDLGTGDTLTFVDTGCGGCRPTFLNDTNGSITGAGTFLLNGLIHANNGFFQGAGTIGSTANVVLNSSSLHYVGSGAGKIIAHGTGNVADGNMAAGQELVIEAVDNGSAVDAKVFFDQASTTAAGTIRLTHAGTGAAGAATLVTAAGVSETFTNSGSIISEDGVGGAASSRAILGNLANSGTVTINRTTTIDRGQSVWSNTGTITIASGKSLIFPDKACGGCQPTFYNLAGGSIAGSGSLTMDNSNNTSNGFFQDAGTIGSSVSVVLHNSGLHLTGTGAGKIYLHAYNVIYGNLASGQELVVERANSEDALANNDLAMTNAGTITLVAGNGSATLRIQGGQTLTNNGTLRGVGTVIAGTVSNAGTVSPGASAGVLTISGNYSQTSGGTLATEIGGATAGTQYDQLAVSGTASLNGTLALSQLNSFVPTSGQTFAIVTHASRTGTFSSVTGASVGGKQYAANYASGTQTTLTVGSSVTRQVDALINQGKSTFIGDGIYNTTGLNQAKTASVKVGVTVSFKIKIQNDGTGGSDQFFVLASGSNVNGFTVVYKKGTKNITSQVLAGTYKTAAIAPGGSVTIRVKIVASNKAVKNSAINRIVTLTSAADGTKQDAVKITVTRI